MCTTPYRVAAHRESSPLVIVPREPVNWARVGSTMWIGGVFFLLAGCTSAGILSHDVYGQPAESAKWIMVACIFAIAIGVTMSIMAKGDAFHYSEQSK